LLYFRPFRKVFKFIPLLRLRECFASRCRKCKSDVALRTDLATLAANVFAALRGSGFHTFSYELPACKSNKIYQRR